jgi:hypothetical protein
MKITGLENLETSEHWESIPSGRAYRKVYWLTHQGEVVRLGDHRYEVRRDPEGVRPFEPPIKGAQAVLLRDGKPMYGIFSQGKQYFTVAELDEGEAVVAFLPAGNII